MGEVQVGGPVVPSRSPRETCMALVSQTFGGQTDAPDKTDHVSIIVVRVVVVALHPEAVILMMMAMFVSAHMTRRHGLRTRSLGIRGLVEQSEIIANLHAIRRRPLACFLLVGIIRYARVGVSTLFIGCVLNWLGSATL